MPVLRQVDGELVGRRHRPRERAAAEPPKVDHAFRTGSEPAGHALALPCEAAWERVDAEGTRPHTRTGVLPPFTAERAVARDVDGEVELGACEDRMERGRI